MSPQQPLEFENELRKLAGEVCRDGLPYPHRPEATMALAVAIRDELRSEREALRASKAGALVTGVFDRTMQQNAPGRRRRAARLQGGVHLLLPQRGDGDGSRDLFGRERAARSPRCPIRRGVAGRCDAVGATAGIRRSPCPLLHDNLCSVYAARPSVCRKHSSFSVDACIADYEGRGGEIPIRRFDQEIFECCAVALLVGMRLWDERQGAVFELSGALRVALQDPQAEQRWLAGEAVFAGVASQSKLPGIDEHAAFLWGRFVG